MQAILYLEDGTTYFGKGFGAQGTSVGELVFNTSMVGYEEVLTDPSYAGQIITMTYPLIGNYGVNKKDMESNKIYARGFIVRNISRKPSNYMCEGDIDSFLKSMNIVGLYDVDTRSITKHIRSLGTMKCVISNEEMDTDKLKEILKSVQLDDTYVEEVSTKEIIHIKGSGKKVALMDFGAKKNIVRCLQNRNCDITILPYDTPIETINKINPDGIMLSNGPGDPKAVAIAIETIKSVIKSYPTFGICLGHQIIALAVGGDTYKMKFGHRGGNHGVYDIERDKAYITSQNHGFAVAEESVVNNGMIITHRNLNDGTIEGMKHKSLPVFSVQFHPEAAPGPVDTEYLFETFLASMDRED